jgi:hypothetical protein
LLTLVNLVTYAVVAFGDAVVLVSGGGAVVNNIAVAVFGDVAVVATGDLCSRRIW